MKRRGAALLFVWSLLVAALVPGCDQRAEKHVGGIEFWHTFNSEETAALQEWLDKTGEHQVITTILPFARANIRFRSALQEGACPDLLRIDATRIPGLVESHIAAPVPPEIWEQHAWLDEAQDLVRYQGQAWGLPQSLDGLALIRKRGGPGPWPFESLAQLEKFAAGTDVSESDHRSNLGVLIDGYWFLAFMRNEGSVLPGADGQPPIHTAQSVAALERFAALFRRGWAMKLLDERNPSFAMTRAFRQDLIDVALTGPWDLIALADGDLETLEVSAFPGHSAPRGGQVLVVPKCSTNAPRAWALALSLSAPVLQEQWARQLGTIPVTAQGLERGGRVVNEFYRALANTEPLPRHPRAPEFFDDLTPAVRAVVGGDATADEALAGVDRAWQRLSRLPQGVPLEP